MPKDKKPLGKKEREAKQLAEERRARRKAELEAIMASDNPPRVCVYRNLRPYKDGWHYVYERRIVHVKLLGKETTVQLSSTVLGKLPPGERDIGKMIPTGDTGPKGAVKRRRAEEAGKPLYKEREKPTAGSGKPGAAQKLDQESPVRETGPEKTTDTCTDTCLVTLSANGQVVVPSRFRRLLGLKAGDTLMCGLNEAGGIAFFPVASPSR